MMDRRILINKQSKKLTREELSTLSREELIATVIRLQSHNSQLKNILQKKLDVNDTQAQCPPFPVGKPTKRTFDFSNCNKRHVLLKFLYFGWDYQGLSSQEDTNDTIEYHMFNALTKTCLIESRQTSNYHRCGRTDKEVSAFSQVISIDLRSKFPEEEQMSEDSIKTEFDYCTMLNRVLPNNIQCIAWMPLDSKEYSARFDCKSRSYRYYFPKGDLDLDAMRKGCEFLSGAQETDFRNLCKMDVNNGVTNFKRNIYSATIQKCADQDLIEGYQMYYLEIKANSFLWHQIRCIMAVLLLIGKKYECPEVIKELLDVDTNPCKPQYSPAAAFPLNLYACEFSKESKTSNPENKDDEANNVLNETAEWAYDKQVLSVLIQTLQCEWTKLSIRTTMAKDMLVSLEKLLSEKFGVTNLQAHANVLESHIKSKQYQRLMTRKRCESLENRIDHFVKKQRLILKK